MSMIVVHLDDMGNITSIQREKEPQYIRGDYPSWLRERIALLRMLDGKGDLVHLKGFKVNPNYIFLDVTKKELTEVGKLLGT
jgi:hypothetical protein